MEDLHVTEQPGMHRYSPVQGRPDFLAALADRVSKRHQLGTSRGNILVTAGATGGLSAVIGSLVEPGEEVLLMAPFWPLIAGIVRSFRAHPIPVPLFGYANSPDEAIDIIKSYVTDKTVAIYWNTPNNPTGRILPRSWLRRLTEWAREQDLWILADEVYEDYCYSGPHASTRPLAPERTFSVHSFSKAYGMAGNRCGYVVGPESLITEARKVSTHIFYSAPTASQITAHRVLSETGDRWLDNARRVYEETGRAAAERLGIDPPGGGTFLFLDVAEHLDANGLPGFLERCIGDGLLVAPGTSFGPFETHIRICFTSAPPDATRRGVEVLARLLGR
jgi:N-succinyldiaminopimelate aminotransferase